MDLDRLSEFMIIAEEKSFKSAAARLGVVPNVLSTRFRGFEQSLGAELFERDAHHFELTESGQSLMKHAKGLLDSYDKMRISMQSIQGASFRSLRLMLCAQTMAADLGPFLDRYCRRYPTLFLGLYDENTCDIREGLQSGEIDIAFAVGREDDFTDISGRVILNDYPKMKVHVPNDHRLAKAHSVSFSELSGETFILYPKMREPFTRDLQLSMLEQSGISYQIYEEDYSPFFYDLLVPVGKGIRLWNWADRLAPNSKLITIQDAGYEAYLYMLYHTDTENETVSHFIKGFTEFRKGRK